LALGARPGPAASAAPSRGRTRRFPGRSPVWRPLVRPRVCVLRPGWRDRVCSSHRPLWS